MPDTIRRWRREGVSRTKPNDNLHQFCAAVCSLLHLSATADQIAHAIIDDRLSEYDFARMVGIQKIEADYLIAQYEATRGNFFPDRTKLHDTSTLTKEKKDHAFGIYIVERQMNDDRRASVSRCLLVIGRYIEMEMEREHRGFVFSKLYVPRMDAADQVGEYSGMLLQSLDHRYFFLQSTDDLQDFVIIITNVGPVPLQKFEGLYFSVNIEGQPYPDHRKVTIVRKDASVTDALIERHLRELIAKIRSD